METNELSAPVHPNVSILLLGAGSSTRAGGQSKAFLKLGDETFLECAVRAARSVTTEVVVGLASAEVARGQQLIGSDAKVVAGGASRQETIERLVDVVEGSAVVVHDVARPYATPEIFSNTLQHLSQHVAVVPAVAVPVRDSLCRSQDGFVDAMVDRKDLLAIQTPQAFDAKLLRLLLAQAKDEGRNETSLVTLFRQAGHAVKIVDGDAANTKITYVSDLPDNSSD